VEASLVRIGLDLREHGSYAPTTRVIEHHAHIPGPPLRQAVAEIWYVRADERPFEVGSVMPDAATFLFINLGAPHHAIRGGDRIELSRAWIVGAQPRWLDVAYPIQTALLGIRFRVGGAHLVFGDVVGELAGNIVDLDRLWRDSEALRDRVAMARSPRERFAIVEQALTERMRSHGGTTLSPATVAAMISGAAVSRVARDHGLSERHLHRRCVAEVGLAPKQLARIARFQRSLQLAWHTARPWTAIGLDAGYYDQAHMIREFRDLAGMTPGEYLARRTEYIDEIASPDRA
jgi:AraC-like DNA-binding protein